LQKVEKFEEMNEYIGAKKRKRPKAEIAGLDE
jgi:hypothetical protein